MKKNHSIIDIPVIVRHKTPKAILLENLKGENVWIPLSQIELEYESENDIRATMQIPEWLAIEKELV